MIRIHPPAGVNVVSTYLLSLLHPQGSITSAVVERLQRYGLRTLGHIARLTEAQLRRHSFIWRGWTQIVAELLGAWHLQLLQAPTGRLLLLSPADGVHYHVFVACCVCRPMRRSAQGRSSRAKRKPGKFPGWWMIGRGGRGGIRTHGRGNPRQRFSKPPH